MFMILDVLKHLVIVVYHPYTTSQIVNWAEKHFGNAIIFSKVSRSGYSSLLASLQGIDGCQSFGQGIPTGRKKKTIKLQITDYV